jgi:hypothetical protein
MRMPQFPVKGWLGLQVYRVTGDQDSPHCGVLRSFDQKVDERLAGEEPFPEAVALAFGNDQLHEALLANRLVTAAEFRGIGLQRHHRVVVAVDDADGDVMLGQHCRLFDRAEFAAAGGERVGRKAVGWGRVLKARIGFPVVDRIDATQAGGELGMSDGPGRCPEAPAAAAEHCGLGGVASADHVGVKSFCDGNSRRAAIRLARVDAGHGNACFGELLVHPPLGLIGVGRQGGGVENPGLAVGRVCVGSLVESGRGEEEGGVAFDAEDLPRQEHLFFGGIRRADRFGLGGLKRCREDAAKGEQGCRGQRQRET